MTIVKRIIVGVDSSVERLIVVSDLHAFSEPLQEIDSYLDQLADRYQVFANGDLFSAGVDSAETVDWVRWHASGRTTRGNHDLSVSREIRRPASEASETVWPDDSEYGNHAKLSDDQLRFARELPDQLLIQWRGKLIRMMHGHGSLLNASDVDWKLRPDQLFPFFRDTGVDLTLVAHTHFPFVHERDGFLLANSGSVAGSLFRLHGRSGEMIDRSEGYDYPIRRGNKSSFLSITERNGSLTVEIVWFDYDRQGLLDRYGEQEGLGLPFSARRAWIADGCQDPSE